VHLVFVVNHAAFFVSHRLPIAIEARRRGWNVTLVTGMAGSDTMEGAASAALQDAGIVHHRVPFGSATVNPLRELRGLLALVSVLRRLRPGIVHAASPKGILYGGIAARVARVPALVLAISGMGYAFVDGSDRLGSRRLIGGIFAALSRLAFAHRNLKVIVQNEDDRQWVRNSKLCPPGDVQLIRGSGVDIARFTSPEGTMKLPLVVLPARLLRDKGVVEFVEAVRRIRQQVPDWRFVIAGAADYRSPSAVSTAEIEGWVADGLVEWPGHVQNIAPLLAQASIVCLPSYREGLPKALLEAAAAGSAVITTDAVGCREAVVAGMTGDLVPVRNVEALASALLALIRDAPRREAYGESGKLLAEQRFSLEAVLAAIFDLYATLLARV
jgi:glycosyltransferase involved in cell wall biosynthesis